MENKNRQKDLRECQKMVCEYLHRLEKWKVLYIPGSPDLPMDERFEEACENLSYIEYLADYLTFADEEEGFEVVKSMKETGYLEDLKGYYKAVLYRWFYGRFPVYVRTERMDKLIWYVCT